VADSQRVTARQATNRYKSAVSGIRRQALFRVTNILLDFIRRYEMSKILATLVAGLFAASVFAADAPKADIKAAPAAAATTTAPAAATGTAKAKHKHHKHAKKAAATPAAPAAPAK
jgi:hypothetical protein